MEYCTNRKDTRSMDGYILKVIPLVGTIGNIQIENGICYRDGLDDWEPSRSNTGEAEIAEAQFLPDKTGGK